MIRAFQWDLARQVERLDFLQRQLPRYAAWGYEELYLHLEDAVEYPRLPGLARPDAYSYRQLGQLVRTATRAGIRTVPIVNLLGHTQYLIQHRRWRDLNELRDNDDRPLAHGQLCPLHPRTLGVAEKLLRDMAPFCTAGLVHVGLDESFHLGSCPRCRAEIRRHGRAAHFANYVHRLHALCTRLGLRLGLWADMLYFVPDAVPLLPPGLTFYEWYYHAFPRLPRVELFNFAEVDLATPLRAHGHRYYGCPMNGAFRHEPLPVFGDRLANLRAWWRRCADVSADGFLVTSWEAYRLALETTTVVDAAAASLWLEPDATADDSALLGRGLERVHGLTARHARDAARRLLAADAHAFAGYARWQINTRWDCCAGGESVSTYTRELAFFQRLAALNWPEPLAASLAWRVYLAQRDVFVRTAAREIFQARRLLAKGREAEVGALLENLAANAERFAQALAAGLTAARQMWKRTRRGTKAGQNEAMHAADAGRLRDWRAWLTRARRELALISGPTPVCGAWQLQFIVHNFAPAAQRVAVEQRQPDGTWRELAARHTIEFRSTAARPTSKLRRDFNVPVDDPRAPLRLTVRGGGQVAFSHFVLTDGVRTIREKDWRARRVLGTSVPVGTWPPPASAAHVLPLSFPTPSRAGRAPASL